MQANPVLERLYEQYRAKVTFVSGSCAAWPGPHRIGNAARDTGVHKIPVIEQDGSIYDAAKVGYALIHKLDAYPSEYARMTCGHLWCANGYHVRLEDHSGLKRGKRLEDTTHYEARKKMITKILVERPFTTHYGLERELRALGLGGKHATLGRIIARVRAELGLPAHAPWGRKKK